MLVAGLLFAKNYYTGWTLVLCGLTFWIIRHWLSRIFRVFWVSYIVLLIPFFIVNGILTGTGIEQEVVWYNDAENMGIRALTIPVEDFFYGLLMIVWNIVLFERFRKNKSVDSANS
jgi:lycopene cyclase domain-containing protein